MKIKTYEYDTTARWTIDSRLFLRSGRFTTDSGIDKGGIQVPGAQVIHPLPSVDDMYLRISWPEITVQALIERIV